MSRWIVLASAGVMTLAACSTAPVVGHPNPLSQLESNDPRLATNKRLAFDLWRGVVNAGHVELADKLLAEDYIQHSPLLPTGRAAFKKIFSVVPRCDQIPALIEPPLVAVVAEGDMVVLVTMREHPHLHRVGETYTSTWFDMYRIEGTRLAEHWDSATKPASAAP